MPFPASVQGATPQQMGGWDRYTEAMTPPSDGSTLAYKQNLSSALPGNGGTEPFFKQWAYSLASGATVTVLADAEVPDYWWVWTPAGSGVLMSVYQGPGVAGVGLMISGGGKLKLPGRSEYLTVYFGTSSLTQSGMSNVQGMTQNAPLSTDINPLAGNQLINIVAIRGLDFEVDPGKLA